MTPEKTIQQTIKRTDVKAKVISQHGFCACGHQLGDEWIINGKTPLGLCNAAYIMLLPYVFLLRYGASFEYPGGSGVIRLTCNDAWNPVIFELSAVPGSTRVFKEMPTTCGHLEHLPYKPEHVSL